MKRRILTSLALLTTASAWGQVLFQTSFESQEGYSPGTLFGQGEPQWAEDNAYNPYDVIEGGRTGSQCAYFDTSQYVDGSFIWQDLTTRLPSNQNRIHTYSGQIMFGEDFRPSSTAGIELFESTNLHSLMTLRARPSINNDGQVYLRLGQTEIAHSFTPPKIGKWTRFQFGIDQSNGKCYFQFGDQSTSLSSPMFLPSSYVPLVSKVAEFAFFVSPDGFNEVFLDDVKVEARLPQQVSGIVRLQNWLGTLAGVAVKVQILTPSGVAVETKNLVLDTNGSFKFTPTYQGAGKLAVKSSHWLRAATPSTAFTRFGIADAEFDLINGDCDGDNYIGSDDYLILSNSFDTVQGSPSYDARADLDGSGDVGTDDYIILNLNFDINGD